MAEIPWQALMGRNGIDEDAGDPGVAAEGIIRQPTANLKLPTGSDVRSLAMIPGSPGYAERIPPPEKLETNESPLILPDSSPPPSPSSSPPSPTGRRVAIYVSRTPGVFSVQIEEAPDWDTVKAFKLTEDATLDVQDVLRALGVKIADKTGGDLLEAREQREQRSDRPHQRKAAPRARPRASGREHERADRPSPDQWTRIAAEIGALDDPAGVGEDGC